MRPSYDLGTRYKLALRARLYVEEEFTLPDNKTGQQFGGWVYSAGYPERIISQNTVTVNVLGRDRDRIAHEAAGRNGRVVDSG